ncbi:MAG: hypothetical protein HEEMFOPI_00592 [Holosporales bacterium]
MNLKYNKKYFQDNFSIKNRFLKSINRLFFKYFLFEKPNFTKMPPYFCVTITPSTLMYKIIDAEDVIDEDIIELDQIDYLFAQLNEYKDFPVYILLKDFDVTVKHLDLKNAAWLNKYFIREEFQKGEFKENELFFCQKSSVVMGLYRFISIPHNDDLNHVLSLIAANMKNFLMGIDIEEVSFLKELAKKTDQKIMLPLWRIILKIEDDQWKMIIGCKDDLVLIRHGQVLQNSFVDRESYFIKELVDTTKYLKRLGWNEDLKIAFYADPKNFKRQSLSDYQMIFCDLSYLDDLKISPPYFFEMFNSSLKKIIALDFYKKRMTSSFFYIHSFFFKLYQFVINIVSPSMLFASFFCLIYGVKISYYNHAIDNIDYQMNQISPIKEAEHLQYDKSLNFLFFKNNYKKNPIIAIKGVYESLPANVVAEKVDWCVLDDRVKITFELQEKQKAKNGKSFKLKEVIENNIQKKIPSFTPQWQDGSKNLIILNLVGPN